MVFVGFGIYVDVCVFVGCFGFKGFVFLLVLMVEL